jgi:hypothetical protein
MDAPERDMDELELALLRRGLDELSAECERCSVCRRSPLIGERIYGYASGAIVCELCKASRPEAPLNSRLVHGPEFGHTLRIADHRAAA